MKKIIQLKKKLIVPLNFGKGNSVNRAAPTVGGETCNCSQAACSTYVLTCNGCVKSEEHDNNAFCYDWD